MKMAASYDLYPKQEMWLWVYLYHRTKMLAVADMCGMLACCNLAYLLPYTRCLQHKLAKATCSKFSDKKWWLLDAAGLSQLVAALHEHVGAGSS